MFSRIVVAICAVYLIIFAISQVFGAGVGNWSEWLTGVAFGIAAAKLLDLIPDTGKKKFKSRWYGVNGWGGKRKGAGRPTGWRKDTTSARPRHYLVAYDDEWDLIKKFAEMVKHGDKSKAQSLLSSLLWKVGTCLALDGTWWNFAPVLKCSLTNL